MKILHFLFFFCFVFFVFIRYLCITIFFSYNSVFVLNRFFCIFTNNNERKRKKRKISKRYEILRKKGKMLLKQSRYRDILYCKCILFYTF